MVISCFLYLVSCIKIQNPPMAGFVFLDTGYRIQGIGVGGRKQRVFGTIIKQIGNFGHLIYILPSLLDFSLKCAFPTKAYLVVFP
jgi:hypothetical protein